MWTHLDCKHFNVHLVTRSEFVDQNIVFSWTWTGEPRALTPTWLPDQVSCGHVTVLVFSSLPSLLTANIETELESVLLCPCLWTPVISGKLK